MRVLLAAHPDRLPEIHVIQPRLLHHLAARFDQLHLPLNLVLERHLQKSERIQILHLRLRPKLLRTAQPHRHIRIAAQLPLLHIAIRHADILHHLLDLGQIRIRFVRRPHIRLAHNLDQRRSRAVQIDIRIAVRILEAVVQTFSRIVLHMHARHANPFLLARRQHNIQIPVLRQRLIVLRDLIALRQVRIKVVLTRKSRKRIDPAMQRNSRADREFHRLPAEHRQCARQPQTHRTHIRIRRRPELHRTTAENLRLRAQLDVHLEPDHRLIFRQNFFARRSLRHLFTILVKRCSAFVFSRFPSRLQSPPTRKIISTISAPARSRNSTFPASPSALSRTVASSSKRATGCAKSARARPSPNTLFSRSPPTPRPSPPLRSPSSQTRKKSPGTIASSTSCPRSRCPTPTSRAKCASAICSAIAAVSRSAPATSWFSPIPPSARPSSCSISATCRSRPVSAAATPTTTCSTPSPDRSSKKSPA